MKKTLKKNIKDYQNVILYVTAEATVNSGCTDTGDNSSSTRIYDQGTVRCN